jgi:hypothetical protein
VVKIDDKEAKMIETGRELLVYGANHVPTRSTGQVWGDIHEEWILMAAASKSVVWMGTLRRY